MKKFWFQIAVLLVVIFGALYLNNNPGIIGVLSPVPIFSDPAISPTSNLTKIKIVAQGGSDLAATKAELNVEIADTKEKRANGLGGRIQLDTASGMLFVFDHADIHKFWMKGMKIPLDFIWVSKTRVVDILPNVQPPANGTPDNALPIYAPVVKIDKVLEVNAGFAALHKITIGDSIEAVQ